MERPTYDQNVWIGTWSNLDEGATVGGNTTWTVTLSTPQPKNGIGSYTLSDGEFENGWIRLYSPSNPEDPDAQTDPIVYKVVGYEAEANNGVVTFVAPEGDGWRLRTYYVNKSASFDMVDDDLSKGLGGKEIFLAQSGGSFENPNVPHQTMESVFAQAYITARNDESWNSTIDFKRHITFSGSLNPWGVEEDVYEELQQLPRTSAFVGAGSSFRAVTVGVFYQLSPGTDGDPDEVDGNPATALDATLGLTPNDFCKVDDRRVAIFWEPIREGKSSDAFCAINAAHEIIHTFWGSGLLQFEHDSEGLFRDKPTDSDTFLGDWTRNILRQEF
ncbi:MAG: hypothetical protein AB1696_16735 [Planctomycetota bacterium]